MAPTLDMLPSDILFLSIEEVHWPRPYLDGEKRCIWKLALTSRRLYQHCLPLLYRAFYFSDGGLLNAGDNHIEALLARAADYPIFS